MLEEWGYGFGDVFAELAWWVFVVCIVEGFMFFDDGGDVLWKERSNVYILEVYCH